MARAAADQLRPPWVRWLDAQPGRTVADCASDVRAICAALGIGRLAMWGLSGGGPHVLACAALLPDLVTAAAALGSYAPFEAEGLDWFAGMGQAVIAAYRQVFTDPAAARTAMEERRAESLATRANELAQLFAAFLAPADAAVLTEELAGFITDTNHAALAPGSQGSWDDIYAVVHPWGFELTDISIPVLLLHGSQDKFIPFAHGQWLATHIPGVAARLLADDGHLTLQEHRISDVHCWLRQHL
ncbi:MAG TPA: alpha/beta fold hydrolase [Streptosporangiaceae bacterium]|nr:alpha/beta fold hydrolase [Streptosporangiaceae bacterium]